MGLEDLFASGVDPRLWRGVFHQGQLQRVAQAGRIGIDLQRVADAQSKFKIADVGQSASKDQASSKDQAAQAFFAAA